MGLKELESISKIFFVGNELLVNYLLAILEGEVNIDGKEDPIEFMG